MRRAHVPALSAVSGVQKKNDRSVAVMDTQVWLNGLGVVVCAAPITGSSVFGVTEGVCGQLPVESSV